jgi:molecular chaperone HscB
MDPFAVLGLPRRYALDPSELDRRYRELQKALHPDRHVAGSSSQRRMALLKAVEVNEAYRTLKDDLRRAEALLAVHGGHPSESAEDPEFLMEVMELREGLSNAKAAHDSARVDALAADVALARDRALAKLLVVFDGMTQEAAPAELAKAAVLVGRLKYFRRFLDEVAAIREEALA